MKIDIVCPFFHPIVGGAESYSLGVAGGMARKGHDVTVHTAAYHPVTGEKLAPSENYEAIRIRRYDPAFRLLHYYWWWKPEISSTDVVHLIGYAHAFSDRTAACYSDKFPMVSTPGMVDVPIQGRWSPALKETYDRFLGVRRLNSMRKLILWYENERAWCRTRGIADSKLEVLPIGISEESFGAQDPSPVKKELGLLKYILYLGRIHAQRGVRHVVEAFEKIARDFPDVSLVLAGPDNGELEPILKFAKDRGLLSRIKHAGIFLGKKKYELISGCEFFAYPPLKELQGVSLLEAMAQGKTVLTSGLDNGLPDYIRHDENGVQVKFGDVGGLAGQMRRLLSNPDTRSKIGEKARQTARKFAWPKILDRTEEIYIEARHP